MPILQLENPTFISVDGAGRPNAGGTVEVYVADGLFSTFATIYSNQVKTTELPNPVTLDDAGTKEIWYDVKVDIREKTKAGVLIRDTENLDPNAGNAVVQGFNLANNGSFEIDDTNDGQPDTWTISPYVGSAIAITSDIVTDGTKALEFNTAGAGTGGGVATSAKFPVTEGSVCSVAWSFYATHATTTNTFVIKWYDEDDVYKSESTLTMPASGSVPTSWTPYQEEVTVDADGTQGEIVLTGIGSGGSNLSSKAYFDGIRVTQRELDITNLINGTNRGGALVYLDSNQLIPDAANTAVSFSDEEYDTSSFFSIGSPTRFTIPTGVTKVRLNGAVEWAANATGYRYLFFAKNGATTFVGNGAMQLINQGAVVGVSMSTVSAVLEVAATDYFELYAAQNSGGALNIAGIATGERIWFCLEAID